MMKNMVIATMIAALLTMSGCANMSNTKKGAVIGGGTGAVVGGVIGKATGNTAVGAIIGAAIGGAAGAYIGRYMDRQAEEIQKDIEGAKVERVGEGIKITFDSGLMFALNKSELTGTTKANLDELATILNKYEDTEILLEGHTDASGSDEYNLELSKKRAQAVSNHLASAGVSSVRFTIMGYGEAQPIADNDTDMGRQQNRRVEVAIFANDELKKAAERETQG